MDFEKAKKDIYESISKEEESKVINHVKIFQQISKSLKENLAKLAALKKEGKNDEATKELIARTFATIVQLRMNHRDLYTEVEKNRVKTQIEKDKIDLLSNYYESINYQKGNILREISECKNKEFANLSQLQELSSKVKGVDDDLENIPRNHQSLLKEFSVELENRKKVKLDYEEKEQNKTTLIKKCDDDKSFLSRIPPQVTQISEAAKRLQHLYRVSPASTYDQITLSKNLPKPLYQLYRRLFAFKDSNLLETVEVELKETSDLRSKHDFDNLQILFTLQKDKQDQGLKKYSDLKEDKTLFSGIYPLKFFFTYSYQHNAVLAALEKRQYSSEDLLTNLINNEPGLPPYPNPKNENEKTANSKYLYYSWVQELTKEVKPAILSQNEAELLSVSHLVKRIRRRVDSKILVKFQIDNLSQIPPRILAAFELFEPPRTSYTFLKCTKVSLEDYYKFINLPKHLLEKKDQDVSLLPTPTLLDKINSATSSGQTHALTDIYSQGSRKRAYAQYTHLESELDSIAQLKEEFYHIELENSRFKVSLVIIVNHDYPQKETHFVVKATQETIKKKVPKTISDKFNQNALKAISSESSNLKPVDPQIIDRISREVNRKCDIPDNNFEVTFKYLRFLAALEEYLR